jgi:hypothetical protein
MAYTVMISEAQRALIVEALEQAPELVARHCERAKDLEKENLTYLLAALVDLPASDQPPGVVHGLCL